MKFPFTVFPGKPGAHSLSHAKRGCASGPFTTPDAKTAARIRTAAEMAAIHTAGSVLPSRGNREAGGDVGDGGDANSAEVDVDGCGERETEKATRRQCHAKIQPTLAAKLALRTMPSVAVQAPGTALAENA